MSGLTIYFLICGFIFIGSMFCAIYEDIKFGPNLKSGYNVKNPVIMAGVIICSIPFVNVLFIVWMIYNILHCKWES